MLAVFRILEYGMSARASLAMCWSVKRGFASNRICAFFGSSFCNFRFLKSGERLRFRIRKNAFWQHPHRHLENGRDFFARKASKLFAQSANALDALAIMAISAVTHGFRPSK
jgi:hypothetical protein